MRNFITALAIHAIKKRIANLNQKLIDEEIYLYESGTEYCVVVLVNTKTNVLRAQFGLNALSTRDQCLIKAFLSLVENLYVKQPITIVA